MLVGVDPSPVHNMQVLEYILVYCLLLVSTALCLSQAGGDNLIQINMISFKML